MPTTKYVIELSEAEKTQLTEIITKGTAKARTILSANILLASDRNSKKYMTVAEITQAYHTTHITVQNVRSTYCEEDLEAVLTRKKRETSPVPAKVTREVEAHIIALACGVPPKWYSK